MKWLFATLATLLVAVVIALFVRQDPGYVMIQYRDWTIESSLALMVLAVLCTVLALYLLIWLGGNLYRLPRRLREVRRRHAARRAQAALVRGFLDLYEGRYERAEKRLIKYAGYGETPAALNYLGAARAAQATGADERRDRYLERADEVLVQNEAAAALTRAELLLERGQYQAALAVLNRRRDLDPKNRVVLTLLLRLYREVNDWEHVLELLPAVRKQRLIDPDQGTRLELRAYRGLFIRADRDGADEQAVTGIWQRVPRELRARAEVLREYVRRLTGCGAADQAEEVLYRGLTEQWNSELVYLYGLIEGSQPARQLRRSEEWLMGHESDPVLLLTVGRLCRRNALWGKARQYLEACIACGGTHEAFNQLAHVLEKMGEREAAMKHYRKGLALMEADLHHLAWKGGEAGR